MQNIPILQAQRISILPLSKNDVQGIFSIHSNSEVNQYLERSPTTNISEAEAFIKKIIAGFEEFKWYYWSIFFEAELIGTICIWNFLADNTIAELGYQLHPKYQGNGFMSEALKAVILFAFEDLNLKQLDAYTHKDNNPSIELLLKHDFEHDFLRYDTKNINHIVFRLKPTNPQILAK